VYGGDFFDSVPNAGSGFALDRVEPARALRCAIEATLG
jgi:hypothetical protein